MKGEEQLNHFVKSLILLIRFENFIKDSFFWHKFDRLINDLAVNYIMLLNDKNNAAQYLERSEKCLGIIENLLDTLHEMAYLNFLQISPLSIRMEMSILKVKLDIIKLKKDHNSKLDRELKKNNLNPDQGISKEIFRNHVRNKSNKLHESKKRLLEFIKSYPDRRTKDLIYEFNTVSSRTVKRNLTELLQAGLLKKRIENGAVYYSTTVE